MYSVHIYLLLLVFDTKCYEAQYISVPMNSAYLANCHCPHECVIFYSQEQEARKTRKQWSYYDITCTHRWNFITVNICWKKNQQQLVWESCNQPTHRYISASENSELHTGMITMVMIITNHNRLITIQKRLMIMIMKRTELRLFLEIGREKVISHQVSQYTMIMIMMIIINGDDGVRRKWKLETVFFFINWNSNS